MSTDLSLRQRILLGGVAPLLLLLGSMAIVFVNVRAAGEAVNRLEEYRNQEDGAYQLALSLLGMQRGVRGYLLLRNSSSIKSYEDSEKAFQSQKQLLRQVHEPQQQEILRRLLDLGTEVNTQTRQVIEMLETGKEAEAFQRYRNGEDFRRTREQVWPLTMQFLQGARELRQQQQARYREAIDGVDRSMLFGPLGAIVLAVAASWWVATALSRKISAYALQLASAASQIAATVTEHERTASQQAAAANETSATIEELSASSRQSAQQAANVASLAGDASRSTEEGAGATRQSIAAMASLRDKINRMADHIVGLNEQIGQIGTIAALVRDLAGEINMLALNAAVEASRAGEHGKGFAVVAGEVRKLADQSKQSAERAAALVTEIQKATNSSILMTEDSARMVADVTRQAEQTGNVFEQIADMVANVNMNAQQVMLNAQQQAAAFNQVAEATGSITAGTRETAAGISQTKNAVEQLNLAAQNLKAMA